MNQKVGILSDTHLYSVSEQFSRQTAVAFGACETIIHAGDLTTREILQVFDGKRVFAVHGNMCERETRKVLPASRIIPLGGYRIGVCHGDGSSYNIEERLSERFADADCIIYGHTHQPVAHRSGGILFINPGSFRGTGRYGSPGTYAILTIGPKTLTAELKTLPGPI